ncbi:MAG: hypothetical protein IIB33_04225 [Chloroflexi bacterium]|nr:hypothetical protein [Chloroflexota bacterium]
MSEHRRTENIVGVRFTPAGRVRYFDPGDRDLDVGERVVVETDGVPIEGEVVIAPRQVLYSELEGPLEPIKGSGADQQ